MSTSESATPRTLGTPTFSAATKCSRLARVGMSWCACPPDCRPSAIAVRIALVTAGLALLAPSRTPAQNVRQRDFDAYVARGLQVLRTPGAAIAVVKDGRVVFAKGYGVRSVGDTARVDAHTLFQIASNTKAFTTAALAILADEGKLSWDDAVTKFLPGFQLYDPYVTREFTVRDLVTHRSGLGLGAGDLLWFHSSYNRGEIAHRIRFARPVSSFRSAYAYDNVLYIVAGEIFPAAAAQSWDDFVKNRIFTPLGMSESGTTTTFFTSSRNAATRGDVCSVSGRRARCGRARPSCPFRTPRRPSPRCGRTLPNTAWDGGCGITRDARSCRTRAASRECRRRSRSCRPRSSVS